VLGRPVVEKRVGTDLEGATGWTEKRSVHALLSPNLSPKYRAFEFVR